jgi:putative oxidoreductase
MLRIPPVNTLVVNSDIFITAGFGKLFGGLSGVEGMLSNIGFPLAGVFAVVLGIIEFGGGILIIIGWQTRYVAALLAIVMFVAIVGVKLPGPGFRAAWVDIALLGASLSLMFSGSKTLCVDRKH